jgi:uncharacterized membrane protein YqhA
MSEERPAQERGRAAAVAHAGGLTRFIVLVPVFGLLVGSVALVVVGAIDTVRTILEALGPEGPTTKEMLVDFIELADVFLLAIVLYIIALGLFELFIESDLRLPAWLHFQDLDDLKHRLVGVVLVVLAVLFLGRAVEIQVAQDLFWMGAGYALVIASLAYFLKGSHAAGEHPNAAEKDAS